MPHISSYYLSLAPSNMQLAKTHETKHTAFSAIDFPQTNS